MTAQEAYDKTTELLKAYESGDLHGGNPMQYIEQFASQPRPVESDAVAVEQFVSDAKLYFGKAHEFRMDDDEYDAYHKMKDIFDQLFLKSKQTP